MTKVEKDKFHKICDEIPLGTREQSTKLFILYKTHLNTVAWLQIVEF